MKMIIKEQEEIECPFCEEGFFVLPDQPFTTGFIWQTCCQCRGSNKITKQKHIVFIDKNNKKTETKFPLSFSSKLSDLYLKKLQTSPILNLLKS